MRILLIYLSGGDDAATAMLMGRRSRSVCLLLCVGAMPLEVFRH